MCFVPLNFVSVGWITDSLITSPPTCITPKVLSQPPVDARVFCGRFPGMAMISNFLTRGVGVILKGISEFGLVQLGGFGDFRNAEICTQSVVWDVGGTLVMSLEIFVLEHSHFLLVWIFGGAPELYTVWSDRLKEKNIKANFGFDGHFWELAEDGSEKVESSVQF